MMSTSSTQNENINREKFTRGEKCIFIHLVLTFALILIIVLIYIAHLYAVDHTVYDVFKTRRSLESTNSARTLQIGMAYINLESPVAVCNTILFTRSWSIAPAFCVAMRSEPDMTNVLSLWRIKYTPTNTDEDDLKIIRTIVHPLFIRYSLSHNIGLFQHEPKDTREFTPMAQPFSMNARGHKNMIIGSWAEAAFKEQTGGVNYFPVKIMEPERCNEIMSFIENIREYEFCATFSEKHESIIEHGALVTKDNKIAGIFSWGDKNGKVLPFVILNISFYQTWIRQKIQSNLEIDENLL